MKKSSTQKKQIPRKLNKQGRPLNFKSRDISNLINEKLSNSSKMSSSVSTGRQIFGGPLDDQTKLQLEISFEELLDNISVLPFHVAVEPILLSIFSSQKAILWISKGQTNNFFYSPTLDKTVVGKDSLIFAAAKAKTAVIAPIPMEESEEEEEEKGSSRMFFPFFLKSENIIAVAEVVRDRTHGAFNDLDLQIAYFLIHKFRLYGSMVFSPSETVSFASEFALIRNAHDTYQNISSALMKGFDSKMVDFWFKNNNSKDIMKFDTIAFEFIRQPKSNIGIVSELLKTKKTINAKGARSLPNFSLSGDPLPDDPILAAAYQVDNFTFATILRGRLAHKYFSKDDESKLEVIMPFIVHSFVSSTSIRQQKKSSSNKDKALNDPLENQLTDILDAAALFSTQVSFSDLVKVVQEKSAHIMKAQSCKFILYDQITDQLLCSYDENTNNFSIVSANSGLIGYVAKTSEPLILHNPLSDYRYDDNVDKFGLPDNISKKTQNSKVYSMLIVPVISAIENVVGVLSLTNKYSNMDFTDDDMRVMIALAVFAAIALQNSNVFQLSLNLIQHMNKFIHIYNQPDYSGFHIDDSILIKILKKARDEIKALRVSLFLSNYNKDSLFLYRTVGSPTYDGIKYSLQAFKSKKITTFHVNEMQTLQNIESENLSSRRLSNTPNSSRGDQSNNDLQDSRNSKSSQKDIENGNQGEKEEAPNGRTDMATMPDANKLSTLICCTPIYGESNNNNNILGVLEICVFGIGTPEEIEIYEIFSRIIVLSIQKNKHCFDQIKAIQEEQASLHSILDNQSAALTSIPPNFKAKSKELNHLFTSKFDIETLDEDSLIYLIFSIFHKFGLMRDYNITASQLFLFIFRLKKLNGNDWRRNIESALFIEYFLMKTHFYKQLKDYELLSLILAALCHNLDRSFMNEKMQALQSNSITQLDELYSKESLIESHSCFKAVELLSSPGISFFESINKDEINKIYEIIFQLILATDYQKHFDIINDLQTNIKIKNKQIGNNTSKKLLILKLIMKCSLVAVITTDPSICNKNVDTICNPFFDYGPIDKLKHIVFTSNENPDRLHIDRESSRKSIYLYVFYPMFKILAKLFPNLGFILSGFKANIKSWIGEELIDDDDENAENEEDENEEDKDDDENAENEEDKDEDKDDDKNNGEKIQEDVVPQNEVNVQNEEEHEGEQDEAPTNIENNGKLGPDRMMEME